VIRNSSRLGVFLDAEEEIENLLAEESRGAAASSVAAIVQSWTGVGERTSLRSLEEAASGWAPPYRSGRSNSVVRLALTRRRPSVADRSMLELLLYLVQPKLALDGTTDRLLSRFGSLAGVLAAGERELATVRQMSPAAVEWLQAVGRGARAARTAAAAGSSLGSREDVHWYALQTSANPLEPHKRFLLLDDSNRLLADLRPGQGQQFPVRQLLQACLGAGAAGCILLNLVGRLPARPCALAIERTRQLERALSTADITLQDHLLVSPQSVLSLKASAGAAQQRSAYSPASLVKAA
jgi:DNA repair protein RadC